MNLQRGKAAAMKADTRPDTISEWAIMIGLSMANNLIKLRKWRDNRAGK